MVGYVYMSQIEDTPQNQDMLVYKLTKTTQAKSTLDKVVFFTICDDHSKAKKAIFKVLKANFLYRKDLGPSRFEGNIVQIVKHICETLSKLDSHINELASNSSEYLSTDVAKTSVMEDILDEELMEAAILGQESEDENDIKEQYDLIVKARQTVWYEHDVPPEIDYDKLNIPEVDGNRIKIKKTKSTRVYAKIKPTQAGLPIQVSS